MTALSSVFTLVFVVASLFAMGLGLAVAEVLEPLRNVRLLRMALLANFIIVPVVAIVLSRRFPMEGDLQTGLLLFGMASGTAFVPKLAEFARGNPAFAAGLVALLVVGTVIYLPLVLPLATPGVQVDALAIAGPLFLQMLAPLDAGILVWERRTETAREISSQQLLKSAATSWRFRSC